MGFCNAMIRHKPLLILLISVLLSHGLSAKKVDTTGYADIKRAEKTLCRIAPLVITAETDQLRIHYTDSLISGLDSLLQQPASFLFPFDSLRNTSVSILTAPDNRFRIYTFNMIRLNGDYLNYGFLQVREGKDVRLYRLADTVVRRSKDPLDEELGTDQWYGALYYSINAFKNHRKKMYLLTGYDGADAHSNKKLLDVLWFDNGEPVFGKDIFLDGNFDKTPEYRAIFEFHNESRMVLRYEAKQNLVVLDNLAPAFPEAVNDFYYYIPSGDYDCYAYKKGYWVKDALDQFQLGQGKRPKKPRILPSPSTDPLNPDRTN